MEELHENAAKRKYDDTASKAIERIGIFNTGKLESQVVSREDWAKPKQANINQKYILILILISILIKQATRKH